jgi:hypothetical protein
MGDRGKREVERRARTCIPCGRPKSVTLMYQLRGVPPRKAGPHEQHLGGRGAMLAIGGLNVAAGALQITTHCPNVRAP